MLVKIGLIATSLIIGGAIWAGHQLSNASKLTQAKITPSLSSSTLTPTGTIAVGTDTPQPLSTFSSSPVYPEPTCVWVANASPASCSTVTPVGTVLPTATFVPAPTPTYTPMPTFIYSPQPTIMPLPTGYPGCGTCGPFPATQYKAGYACPMYCLN